LEFLEELVYQLDFPRVWYLFHESIYFHRGPKEDHIVVLISRACNMLCAHAFVDESDRDPKALGGVKR
jgi:hypothetical protein